VSVTPTNPPTAGVSATFLIPRNTTVNAIACKILPPAAPFMSNVVSVFINQGDFQDSDHDGIANDKDACPNSLDVGTDVIVDSCDTHVANLMLPPTTLTVNPSKSSNAPYYFNRNVVGCFYADYLAECLALAESQVTSTNVQTLKGKNLEEAQANFRTCVTIQLDFWQNTQKVLSSKNRASIWQCVLAVRLTPGGGESSSSSSSSSSP